MDIQLWASQLTGLDGALERVFLSVETFVILCTLGSLVPS